MPQVINNKELLKNVIRELDLTAELFAEVNGKQLYAGDLEMLIQGRQYGNEFTVGPYSRLVRYQSEEEVISQGEWGGDTFFVGVTGKLEAWIKDPSGISRRIGTLEPGSCFGEMSLLAGIVRDVTVAVPKGGNATVLEIDRSAFRLLRKLPSFGRNLDKLYVRHLKGGFFEELSWSLDDPLKREIMGRLSDMCDFILKGKDQVICQEGQPIEKIMIVKSGWVKRVRGIPPTAVPAMVTMAIDDDIGVDFLGPGNCLGLDAIHQPSDWKFSVSTITNAEILEVSLQKLAADPFVDQITSTVSKLLPSTTSLPPTSKDLSENRTLMGVEAVINNGLVDAGNLLVIDMDLCVRCGNCSLACHKVHGYSRLVRRGVQITRPIGSDGRKTQTLLSPQACLHCKDAQCLTGCPTGAIHRDHQGYVKIKTEACSGCFDCATQCPYDAITMVPRKLDVENNAPHLFNLIKRLKNRLRVNRPDMAELHAALAADTDNPVAVNCNLCENTGLNPAGAKKQAYSCEENCPTGALIRIHPLKYFTEVKPSLGFVFRDKKHVVGRNIHQKDSWARLWHASGALLVLLFTLVGTWSLIRFGHNGRIINSWITVRWLTGLTGLLLVIAVMTYPLRKQIYRRRAGPLRYWLLAHIYFGVLATAMFFLHAGKHTGSWLTTLLYLSFLGVVITGIWGMASYLSAPRLLTSLEGEPLLFEDLIARRAELRNELAELTSQHRKHHEDIVNRISLVLLSRSFLWRQFLLREELQIMLARAREMFKDRISQSATAEERSILIQTIETMVTVRRVDALILLYRTLRIWILPHVISTSLMLALMLVHVVKVTLQHLGDAGSPPNIILLINL